MSRPLTGTRKQTATGWQASLPRRRGAAQRATYTFRDAEAADRWLLAGRGAIAAGEELPVPAATDLATPAKAATGTSFAVMAERWCQEYYGELWRGDLDRETAVRGHVKRIDAFMRDRGLVMETMVRREVKALQESVTRSAAHDETHVAIPDGLDPDQLVTMAEAVRLPDMASRATLKRRKATGEFCPSETGPGAHRYRVADLYSDSVLRTSTGGLRRGPRTKTLSQDVANDLMWVYTQVCLYAQDHGVAVPQDRDSLAMHRSDRVDAPERQPVSLTNCAQAATRLHAVHQLALWLMRILGLRIGEAFGILVSDVVDQGDGEQGLVTVRAQGGRRFRTRAPDGAITNSDRVERAKNKNSRRVLVIPPTLMALIRTVIEVFHTDEDGNIRTDARLIPGLVRADAGGQGSFREALASAAVTAGVDCSSEEDGVDAVFSCTPHDMRRAILSDLDRLKIKDTHIQRLAGHAPGTAVLHRHYLLDDPKLRPLREIADHIEEEIAAELPAGPHIPTMVSCTTGNQSALMPDGSLLDARLAERGWLITATDETSGDPLLTAGEVAAELGVTVKTARLWMAQGLVPSIVWAPRARGAERRSRYTDVVKVRDQMRNRVTLRDIADEVQQPYHTVYQFVRAQKLELQPWGDRDYVVPPQTGAVLREHYERQAALHRRAVPLSVAATRLNVSVAVVRRMTEHGDVVEDDRAHDGRRMVTRDSVAATLAARAKNAATPAKDSEDLVTWDHARSICGMSDGELASLVVVGSLTRVHHRRRRHITRVSLLRYLAAHAPDRLLVVGDTPGTSNAEQSAADSPLIVQHRPSPDRGPQRPSPSSAPSHVPRQNRRQPALAASSGTTEPTPT